MTGKETLDRAEAEEQSLSGKTTPDLFDGRILVRTQGFEDGIHVRINAGGAPISAESMRPGIALFTLKFAPAANAGGAHLKTFSRRPMRQALRNRSKTTHPQIERVRPYRPLLVACGLSFQRKLSLSRLARIVTEWTAALGGFDALAI